MSRLTQITASALAVAALAPVVATASHNDLRGAPQMTRAGAGTLQVRFTTDKALGRDRVAVAVAHAGTAHTAKAAGRHGHDFRYVARVHVRRDLEVGRKYVVKLTFGDDPAQTRQVVLRSAY